jgi:nucleoside-diphosphate kinase
MIKPDAFKNDTVSDILLEILKAGFKIRGIKITMLTKAKAEEFYDIHKGKEFFDRLTTFMSSGPVMAMVLEKPDAVESLRKLIGKTNPAEAEEGTIRNRFGTDTTHIQYMLPTAMSMPNVSGVSSSQNVRFTNFLVMRLLCC